MDIDSRLIDYYLAKTEQGEVLDFDITVKETTGIKLQEYEPVLVIKNKGLNIDVK